MSTEPNRIRRICKYNMRGMCRFGGRCWFKHENPNGELQNTIPEEVTAASSSTLTESASKRSNTDEERMCGICFDFIMQRHNCFERIFGILPSCNHCFCYKCITKWRKTKEFDSKVSQACPECRTPSDFVYSSPIWIENKEEKVSFIKSEKQRMKQVPCKFFQKGRGRCQFGNACLFQHSFDDETDMDTEVERLRTRRMAVETPVSELIIHFEFAGGVNNDENPDNSDEDFIGNMRFFEHAQYRRYTNLNNFFSGIVDHEEEFEYEIPFFV